MKTLLQDLHFAARQLLRSPGFTLIAVLTLALGIGANTAIFSVVNAVLLRPLPYPNSERLMQLSEVSDNGNQMNVADPNFADWRRQSRSFSALAQYGSGIVSVVGGEEPARVAAAGVSRDFFRALGVQPVRGRAFLPGEQQTGAAPATIVSYSFWKRYLGGEPNFARRTLTFGDRVYNVVGVMPPGFNFPAGSDLWTPSELDAPLTSRTAHNWHVVGRLKPGATREQARSEMSAISRALKQQYGEDIDLVDAAVVPLHEEMVGRVRPALLLLLGAAGLLLLVACANVVNLLLARAAARQRELAIRLALGAGRRRLVQHFLAESLVLSLVGGALGVLLAVWGVGALLALEPGSLPRLDEIRVNWTVLTFALAISVLVAVVLGSIAALRGTGEGVRGVLAEAQRTHAGGGASQRIRGTLVVGQVALTLILLIGVGLLGRSFLRLLAVDPGYRTDGAVVMDLSLPSPDDDAEGIRLLGFHQNLLARLRAVPGVEHVGGVNDFPLGGDYANGTFLIVNGPEEVTSFDDFGRLAKDESRTGYAAYRVANEDYFRAMQIPLVRGRLFDERDAPEAPNVAVISESLAKNRWPNENPIGKLIQFGNMDGDLRPMAVVGIVGDVRERGLDAEPQPTLYGNASQRPGSAGTFHVVMTGPASPTAVIPAARQILGELQPEVPPRFRTLGQIFSASLAARRFSLLLLGVFGVAALLLAMIGMD
ncbi:ABC transporter permease [soil metagenome]